MEMKFIILIIIAVIIGTVYLLVFSTEPKIFEVYITPENPQVGDTITMHAKLQKSFLDIVRMNYNTYHAEKGSRGSGGGSSIMNFDFQSGEYVSVLTYSPLNGTDVYFKVAIDTLFGLGKRIESDEYSFRLPSKEYTGESSLAITDFYHIPENPTSNDVVEFQAAIQNNTEILLVDYTYETIRGISRGSGSGSMQITENDEYSSNPYGIRDVPKFLSDTQVTYWIVVKDTTGNLVKSQKKTFNIQ